MPDLVKMLRKSADGHYSHAENPAPHTHPRWYRLQAEVQLAAANEIERLREALRSAAHGLECCSIGGFESDPDHVIGVYDDIRAALDNGSNAEGQP